MTRFETLEADWLTVAEAQARILASAAPLGSVTVKLADSLGHALAQPVRAPYTLPPWANSAMDGYAVRGSDVRGATEEEPRTLRVVGEVRAGTLPRQALSAGEAIRIMTGAPVPEGADSVVRVEDTDAEAEGGTVRVLADRDVDRNVRPAGEDMEEGDVVLTSGVTVGPGQIGVLASLGQESVAVHRQPRVGVLPNGDELAPLDRFDDVATGRFIPESNSHALLAAIREVGGTGRHLGIARDTPESVERGLLDALESQDDVLLTVAGASMGETDLFKRALTRLGFTLDFWRVKMRPGSPVSFGHLDRPGHPGLPVFGLPGNPASAFVTFHVLVRPFLLALAGHHRVFPPVLQATSDSTLRASPGLTHFYRVRLRGAPDGLRAELTGRQGSGLVRSLGLADGLAIVPGQGGDALPGSAVQVIPLVHGAGWNPEGTPPALRL